MKSSFIVFCTLLFLVKVGRAEEINLIYYKLCEINKEWLYHSDAFQLKDDTYIPKSDVELIQLHLQLVESSLRKANTKHLTNSQINNRINCLNILRTYWMNGVFPINNHYSKRTPYFIDHIGTACAVGYLIVETGYEQFANQIHEENNYSYIIELDNNYKLLNDWAVLHGFSIDELKWIQPTYSSSCWATNASVTHPTCYGYCDGSIELQIPVEGTPPYYISGPICWNLCAGTYTYYITDADSNLYVQTYTVVDPEPIVPSINLINNVSNYATCDGSLSVNSTGGTAPLNYYWLDCEGGFIDNALIADSLCAGEYQITVVDAIGCSNVSSCISLGAFESINENSVAFNYAIFPNPTNEFLTITLSNTTEKSILQLVDITGRTILKTEIEHEFVVNLNEHQINRGCYFLIIENNDELVIEKVYFIGY